MLRKGCEHNTRIATKILSLEHNIQAIFYSDIKLSFRINFTTEMSARIGFRFGFSGDEHLIAEGNEQFQPFRPFNPALVRNNLSTGRTRQTLIDPWRVEGRSNKPKTRKRST